MRKRIMQKLAFLLSVVMVVSLFANINWTVRAEDAGGQIAVTISGNGTLDYTFYERNGETEEYSQCDANAGGAGQIKYNDENKVISIPATAVKMTLKAYPDQNWQSDSASGTKNNATLSAVDNGIFGQDGIIVDNFTVADGFSLTLSFSEQQQQSGLNIPAGSVGFEISNSDNGKVYYSFTGAEDSWTEIGNNGILDSNTCSGKETIYIKAEPNSEQSVDAAEGANYVDIAGNRTNFTADELTGGTASFSYDANNSHKVHIQFTGSASTSNAGDIAIAVKNAQGTSAAYYRIGDTGEFTKIEGNSLTLSASGELQNVNQDAMIYFKADIDSSQVLDANNQNWYRVGDAEIQFDLTQLKNGEAYFTYDPNNTYNVQIAFDGGNGGGEQQDVSFSCTSMNGNENERVDAVEVLLDGDSDWVDYSSGALNSLAEGDTFKVRIKMKAGFTVDKVSLDYESFDGKSRVGYFKESAQPNYDAIISALLSTDGYEITFQPEADSKDANNNSTLQATSTCLRLQYQTAIAYAESVDINWFFQTKDGDNGYGVWTIDENSGADVFVDGVGDSEVIFSFNDNNYGENGDPSKLGYGKENTGENKIQVSYVSAYTGKAGQTVTVTPDTYDYFSAGGYATGTNQNTIHLDDYDGLIDEVYIDVNGDNTFEASEKLTAKDGNDQNIGPYKYYEETLNAAASYNILVRKHKSTRVSLKWSYTESETDYYVDHGKIFIEKVVRGADTLYQAKVNESGDLVLDEQGVPIATTDSLGSDYDVSSSAGEVFLECGDEVTIRLIPTYGYQIESATLNGFVQLTPNTVVSSFTFTVGGNLHMAGTFVDGTDVTDTTGTEKIKDAGIADGGNATDSGNLKLTVADHSGSYAKESAALDLAKGENADATTIATLDMTLDSMVSKGNGQYWTDNITSFNDDIKVNLELNDTTYVPGDTYVVVREHTNDLGQTELEKLTTTYSNGTLEVPTNKFSTYSIVKIPVAEEDRPNMYLGYDPRGEGDEAGSVTVKCDGAELTGTDGFYKYDDPAKAITFELKRPADRVDTENQTYTPVVEVVFPQENADPVVINPTVTGNAFTVTPSTASGLSGSPFMEVYVHWSDYDKVGPDEDEFMFFLNQPWGGGSYEFQNGLTPVKTATLGNESKYIFTNGTEVSVELKPDENKELVEVFLFQDEQGIHYSGDPDAHMEEPEVQRNIEDLKVGEKYILSGLSPWAYVDVFFIDIPVLSDITLNTTGTLYDSMKGSDVSVSSTCKIGEEVIVGTTKLKDQDSYLLAGTHDYAVEFTSDTDENGDSFTVEGTISLTVEHNAVTSISVTTPPTKTSYIYGESFDKTGLKVTATFADASTKDVTDDVTFEGDIVPSNNTIKAVYTKDGVTVNADITISVSHATIDISGLGWIGTTFEYNGTAQGPTFSSTLPTGVAVESKTGASNTATGNYSAFANLKLANGYSSEYYKLVNTSGTTGITVAEDGATATVSQAWSITAKAITDAEITLGTALNYSGAAQTQTIASVKVDGRTLTQGTDYTVTGNTGIAADTYTLTITGQGNYTGTATKDWTIGKKSISGATITLGTALNYNGSEQTQAVSSVAIGESTLTANTDYTISDNRQKDAGIYTLTVNGNGNYTGTATTQFTIGKVTVTPSLTGTVTKVYDGKTTVPESNSLLLQVTGTVASETLTVSATGYAYDDVNVGSSKTITASGITISGDAAKNYTLSGTTATVAGGEITQATPTITLSGLSETTQAPGGAKATLNPADASAQVVIEYQVVDTPAVAATPEVPCNVTHEEGCASLTEGNTIADCNCAKAHTSHDSECGYKAATSGSPATYKWVTTRPTTPGTYQVRAYLPTGTTNVAAIAVDNAVTGSYTLTQYTAPSDSGSNSGSDSSSDSDSDDDSDSSSGSTTTPAPATPTQAETTAPASTANTTTRRPVPATEESNTETASDKTIGVSSGEGAEGWTNIKTEISDKLANAVEAQGDEAVVVTVEMNGENTVPSDVFETIAGQDITVTFDMGNGIVWAVNGMDITADSVEDINFSASTGEGVTTIPAELITGLTEERFSMELTLEYEGEFGFTAVMSVNVDKKNAGKYANLFYFNPKTETMEFICSAPVKEDGTSDLTFTHASDYIIVVDEVAMSVANNLSMDKVVQPVPQETPSELSPAELGAAEKDAFNPLWVLVIGIVVLLIGGIAIVATKMKKE